MCLCASSWYMCEHIVCVCGLSTSTWYICVCVYEEGHIKSEKVSIIGAYVLST